MGINILNPKTNRCAYPGTKTEDLKLPLLVRGPSGWM